LKYVWNHSASNTSNVMGINVPTKYAAWLELIIISVISPNVSFIGHLSGIIPLIKDKSFQGFKQ
jgi:rhomboid domain-containing protein 1